MIPLTQMKFGHFSEGVSPSIAWSADFPATTFVVSEVRQELVCAAFSDTESWLAPANALEAHALFIDDFELVVDQRTGARFSGLDPTKRVGCLVAAGNELRLCVPPFRGGHGYLMLPMQLSGLHLPEGYQLAFSSWKAIKRVGDVEHVLFERSQA
ncbi:hypothetical protein [Novosphingobium olei]|uniref:hypothetical protein n=1 Tax=Novosphingobium olei TaxID=2728851 RepID=UPI00308523D9|nr:hypothetical protein NSDW_10590 [Novosphingobium olei]